MRTARINRPSIDRTRLTAVPLLLAVMLPELLTELEPVTLLLALTELEPVTLPLALTETLAVSEELGVCGAKTGQCGKIETGARMCYGCDSHAHRQDGISAQPEQHVEGAVLVAARAAARFTPVPRLAGAGTPCPHTHLTGGCADRAAGRHRACSRLREQGRAGVAVEQRASETCRTTDFDRSSLQ